MESGNQLCFVENLQEYQGFEDFICKTTFEIICSLGMAATKILQFIK